MVRSCTSALVATLWPVALLAQLCRSGTPADTMPNGGVATPPALWPWPYSVVVAAVPIAIREAGLEVAIADSDTGYFRTGVHYGWPDDETFDDYRHLDSPGVVVTLSVEPTGDSALVLVEGRSVCAIAGNDSTQSAIQPEDVFEFFYAEQVATKLLEVVRPPMVVDVPPRLHSCPALSRSRVHQQGARGTVVLEFVVDTTGVVEFESIRVVSRSEYALASAAIQRLRHCRFAPAVDNGKRVRAMVRMPIAAVAW